TIGLVHDVPFLRWTALCAGPAPKPFSGRVGRRLWPWLRRATAGEGQPDELVAGGGAAPCGSGAQGGGVGGVGEGEALGSFATREAVHDEVDDRSLGVGQALPAARKSMAVATAPNAVCPEPSPHTGQIPGGAAALELIERVLQVVERIDGLVLLLEPLG